MRNHIRAGVILCAAMLFGCGSGDEERVKELEAEVTALEADLDQAEDDKVAAETALSTAEQAKDDAETALTTAQADLVQAQSDLAVAESEVETLQTEVATLTTENDSLSVELVSVQADLATAQADLDMVTAERDQASAQAAMLEEFLSPPPAFFDALYPPVAAQPTLIFAMFGLAGPFEGLITDMMEGDFGNLNADFQAFKAAYEDMRTNVIPELVDLMPMEPVNDLEAAVATGDPAQIGPALGPVGAVCGDCHTQYAHRTRMQYGWRDFDSITVTDPVTSQTVGWHSYMEGMALQFNAIGHNLRQGQVPQAQANFAAFESYYNDLEAACTNCHTTPRNAFVSADVDGMVAALGAEMANANPDPATVGSLSGAIGGASCGGCHNLHFPAQMTKGLWEYVANPPMP